MDKGTEEECNLIHLSTFCRRIVRTRAADHAHRNNSDFTLSKKPVGRVAKLLSSRYLNKKKSEAYAYRNKSSGAARREIAVHS